LRLNKSQDIFAEFSHPEKSYEKLIQSFYSKKVRRSKYLMKYFEGKDIEKLIMNISNSLYSILKENDENFLMKENLKSIHKTLEITQDDYDLYKGLFAITMRENGYSEELVAHFLYGLERVREYIAVHKSFNEVLGSEKDTNQILLEIRQKTKINLPLQAFFSQMTQEQVEIHQKRIINMIFGNVPFVDNGQCQIYR